MLLGLELATAGADLGENRGFIWNALAGGVENALAGGVEGGGMGTHGVLLTWRRAARKGAPPPCGDRASRSWRETGAREEGMSMRSSLRWKGDVNPAIPMGDPSRRAWCPPKSWARFNWCSPREQNNLAGENVKSEVFFLTWIKGFIRTRRRENVKFPALF
jgi:hypothetical protein